MLACFIKPCRIMGYYVGNVLFMGRACKLVKQVAGLATCNNEI